MRLNRDEILLITSIVLALVAGAVVKHYRDHWRLAAHPETVPAAEAQGQE